MMPFPFLEGADPFGYVLHHNMDASMGPLGLTKFTLNMMLSSVVLILMVLAAKKSTLMPTGFLRNIFEAIFLFVRDEMVAPSMNAKDAKKFMPFFVTVFLFILTMNLMGMVPLPYIGGAATSQLSLTIPLAVMITLISLIGGIMANGVGGFLKSFVPSGLPAAVVPLIFVLEIISFVIKHGVLAIRLMANMLGGHLVVGSFIALISIFESYGMAAFSVPMILFINLIEVLVSFLQAYVFTLLAIMFIGSSLHPDH
ncbi:MAG: F0F1 ATP synthase subunit A [Planctomycetota bacterium]